jgi:polyhydroxybutyrate depolymerase
MWNSGDCCGSAQWNGVDDVGFLLAVLDDVSERTTVDATRVYATGLSNGAMMAYRLAAEASDRIAAIAPVAGSRTGGARRRRAHDARHARPQRRRRRGPLRRRYDDDPSGVYSIPHPSVENVLQGWAEHDRCPATAEETDPWSIDDPDRQAVARTIWGPCADGAEIVLWRLRGVGHVWPGPESSYRNWFVGRRRR